MIGTGGALAGAAVGTGVAMIIAGLRRPVPDLTRALARLDGLPAPSPRSGHRVSASREADGMDGTAPAGAEASSWLGAVAARAGSRLADRLVDAGLDLEALEPVRALRLTRLTADLALLEQRLEVLIVRKIGYFVLGVAFPPLLTGLLALLGTRLPWGLPAMASLIVGAVLFMVPDYDVQVRAGRARTELRRAVCTYLELVALERAADAGPIEAVERAADIGDAPAFGRIRDALTRARLDGAPSWRGLSDLAEATGVLELADLADIMAASGREGAAVYSSLRARATSLRTAMTAEDAAAANAASERMIIPVALMGLLFMALVGWPAFARILYGP